MPVYHHCHRAACRPCGCRSHSPRIPCRPETSVPLFSLAFYKRDRLTGRPLEGAVYDLLGDSRTFTARSDASGTLLFFGVPAGSYELRETITPQGYRPEAAFYAVSLQPDGRLLINGVPAGGDALYDLPLARLAFRQVDEQTDRPLIGAQFRLSNGTQAAAGRGGWVDFGFLTPGSYTLAETRPSLGYIHESRVYRVEAMEDGSLTVDGIAIASFRIGSHPYARFTFRKIDAQTGAPLSGAVFRLSNGMQAESDANGWLDFGMLFPGIYGLIEATPPDGYRPSGRIYQVEVYSDGMITVDNQSVSSFVSLNEHI